MVKQLLILIIPLLTLQACAQNYDSFTEMSDKIISKTIPLIKVEELREEQKVKKIVLVDAREKREYEVSHIKGAKYVGYNNFTVQNLKEVEKNSVIVVYCSVGYRSEKIAEKLEKEGYKNLRNLKGGIFDWVNKGYPLVNTLNKKTTEVHAYNPSWGKWLTQGEKVFE